MPSKNAPHSKMFCHKRYLLALNRSNEIAEIFVAWNSCTKFKVPNDEKAVFWGLPKDIWCVDFNCSTFHIHLWLWCDTYTDAWAFNKWKLRCKHLCRVFICINIHPSIELNFINFRLFPEEARDENHLLDLFNYLSCMFHSLIAILCKFHEGV